MYKTFKRSDGIEYLSPSHRPNEHRMKSEPQLTGTKYVKLKAE